MTSSICTGAETGIPNRMTVATKIATPVGYLKAIADEAGLFVLDFIERELPDRLTAPTAVEGDGADHPLLAQTIRELSEYFASKRRAFSIPLSPRGTAFEIRTWNALMDIPYGQTRTYGQQAAALGMPTASRAVGGANGRNRLAIVIPCHRVIGANGSLTGYGGGTGRKRWLLEHERRVAGRAGELFPTAN